MMVLFGDVVVGGLFVSVVFCDVEMLVLVL